MSMPFPQKMKQALEKSDHNNWLPQIVRNDLLNTKKIVLQKNKASPSPPPLDESSLLPSVKDTLEAKLDMAKRPYLREHLSSRNQPRARTRQGPVTTRDGPPNILQCVNDNIHNKNIAVNQENQILLYLSLCKKSFVLDDSKAQSISKTFQAVANSYAKKSASQCKFKTPEKQRVARGRQIPAYLAQEPNKAKAMSLYCDVSPPPSQDFMRINKNMLYPKPSHQDSMKQTSESNFTKKRQKSEEKLNSSRGGRQFYKHLKQEQEHVRLLEKQYDQFQEYQRSTQSIGVDQRQLHAEERRPSDKVEKVHVVTTLKEISQKHEIERPKQKTYLQQKRIYNFNDAQVTLLLKQKKYMDYVNLIRLGNRQRMHLQQKKDYVQYKMYVGKGNNQAMLKTQIRAKTWWHVTEDKCLDLINLFWTQSRNDDVLARIKEINASLSYSTKPVTREEAALDFYVNLNGEPQEEGLGRLISQLFPEEYKEIIQNTVSSQGKKDSLIYLLYHRLLPGSPPGLEYSDLKRVLMHNHLQDNFHLSNKKALFYNMRNYMALLGKDPFSIMPLTFHVKDPSDPGFGQFRETFRQTGQDALSENIWIVKPGENSNRGVGIQVSSSLDEIRHLVQKNTHRDGQPMTYIIQKYIESPLLYNRRKFDVRCFLLVTSQEGLLRGYWYEEGYGRTASQPFATSALANKYVHLTNDAIQAKGTEYGKYEPANKLSWAELGKFIGKAGGIWGEIVKSMKQITALALQAVIYQIDPHRLANTFEVFGLDFMLDSLFKVSLIEINTNPDLETCCNLLQRLIPQMIENALRIAVDPVFLPPDLMAAKKKNPISNENYLLQNRFTLIFDEYSEREALEKVYANAQREDLGAFDDKEEELE